LVIGPMASSVTSPGLDSIIPLHELHSLIFRELFAVIPAFKHRSLRDVLLLVVSEDSAAGSGVNRDIRAAAF